MSTCADLCETFVEEQPSGCWHWTGPERVRTNVGRIRGVIVAYHAMYGSEPPDEFYRTACPNDVACVHPEHRVSGGDTSDTGSDTGFRGQDADHWIRDELARPDPTYLLDGFLIPGGLTVIAGHPKIGKSLIAIDMLISLATGQKHGPWSPTSGPMRVGHIDLDSTPRGTARRLSAFKIARGLSSFGGNYIMMLDRYVKVLEKGTPEKLLHFVDAQQLDVLLVDTVFESFGGNENEAHSLGLYLSELRRIRLATGCAMVLVHHYRKPGPEGHITPDFDPQSDLRGSSALASVYDNVIGVQTGRIVRVSPKEPVAVLMTQGKNEPFRWCTFDLDPPGGRIHYTELTTERAEWVVRSKR